MIDSSRLLLFEVLDDLFDRKKDRHGYLICVLKLIFNQLHRQILNGRVYILVETVKIVAAIQMKSLLRWVKSTDIFNLGGRFVCCFKSLCKWLIGLEIGHKFNLLDGHLGLKVFVVEHHAVFSFEGFLTLCSFSCCCGILRLLFFILLISFTSFRFLALSLLRLLLCCCSLLHCCLCSFHCLSLGLLFLSRELLALLLFLLSVLFL